MSYVTIELAPDALTVRPVGKHRWLSLRSAVRVPRADVTAVEPGGITAENGPVGLRCPGTNIPGRYLAGTFWKFWGPPERRVRSFWVRRHPGSCIRLTFRNAFYDYAMVEVSDPAADIARIQGWLDAGAATRR